MEYKIVSASGFSHKKIIAKLTEEVNSEITLGWEPTGGITIAGNHYCQVLVKRRS